MKLKDSLIIILAVVIAIVVGVFAGVKITEDKNNNPIPNNDSNEAVNDNQTNNSSSNNKVDVSESGKYLHSVGLVVGSRFSSLGEIVVTNAGDVYYVPSEEIMYDGAKEDMILINEKVIGTKKKYKIKGYNEAFGDQGTFIPMEFEGYKLDIANVQSAYNIYFGNGGESETVIFVGKDGKISEFGVYKDVGGFKMVLVKNVEGYSNIVSVIPTSSIGGHSAILIDKTGNYYKYFGYDYFGEE